MLASSHAPARRRASRIPVDSPLWVYWEGPPHYDLSRVLDLSPAGLFLETRFRKTQGDLLSVHFLVQEGQICIEALVRHFFPGRGVGLKLLSLAPDSVRKFDALLARVHSSSLVTC